MLTLIVCVSALAAFNALFVPLYLERVIHTHPRSIALLEAAQADGWLTASNLPTSGQCAAAAAACWLLLNRVAALLLLPMLLLLLARPATRIS